MRSVPLLFIFSFCFFYLSGQDYFFGKYTPFKTSVSSPENFLGHAIGDMHTRHDQIVYYLQKLADQSDRAQFINYGKSYEGRPLVMLCISDPANLANLDKIKEQHLKFTDINHKADYNADLPLIINLGYSVHGNEPSTSEAALLTAYTLVASDNPQIIDFLKNTVIFIDPAINPDGRERHTQWANMYRADNLVSDRFDAEHNENWPRGRSNHYWFDLNRDWLLAINPESRSKLNWYHQWYPNVIGDFHEMGTNSTFFFEPMKTNGSKDPIMPKENYVEITDVFADYFKRYLDSIGSFYFTKEVFDGTYPGYGSSYGDLQGGLALLFEQGSSRGHLQETPYGDMTFAFTIRNQYVSGMATIEASVKNKSMLRKYQHDFFKSAVDISNKSAIKAYSFDEAYDKNRLKAFIDKLLIHKVDVYKNKNGKGYVVPTGQKQYRMVQTFFETYNTYHDSVFYDASAWSLANFYNIDFKSELKAASLGEQITNTGSLFEITPVQKSDYAYILDWDDCNTAGALYHLQHNGIVAATTFRPFTILAGGEKRTFNYGSIVIPVAKQSVSADSLFSLITAVQTKFMVPAYALNSGYSLEGIDLGSRHVQALEKPKALLLIGEGVSNTEAGEVWHLLDTRIHMPLTKVMLHNFANVDMDRYNTLILVSGNYPLLDSIKLKNISQWVGKGNTLIAIGRGAEFLIKNKMVKEKLLTAPKKEENAVVERLPFAQAEEINGKESLGGAIFKTDLDVSHPLGFGYRKNTLAVYKNNTVWISPSENKFMTVSKYSENPHIDGYISPNNLNHYMKNAASLIVSPIGRGRVVLFADNPNFRASWYGTDRLFVNAIFFGKNLSVPASTYEE